MNITTRKDFDALLADLETQDIFAFDTETSGLKPYGTWDTEPNRLISMSFWFPLVKRSYNVAFRHGEGHVDVSWGKKEPQPFESLSWQGKAKGQMYLGHWFRLFRKSVDTSYFENLPIEWMNEIRARWGRKGQTVVMHNARFDCHVLNAEGWPMADKVIDTMILLHLVNEDWRGIEVSAPFKWTAKDAKMGQCTPEQVGRWAYDASGNLMKKTQQGNRQLKWQSAMHGFEGATEGEDSLYSAIRDFECRLTDFIVQHPEDPYNQYAMLKKGISRSKVEDKVKLDEKAHMWMLPSSSVAYYAELDTKLTWDLYEWCMQVIRNWKNEELADTLNEIQHKVAWVMEANGFKLDREQALREVDKLTPRIAEVENILESVAGQWGFMTPEQRKALQGSPKVVVRRELQESVSKLILSVMDGEVEGRMADITIKMIQAGESVLGLSDDEDEDEAFNPSSNPKLRKFLNSGVLAVDLGPDIFPEWWPANGRLELGTYKDARLSKTDKEALEPYENHPVVRLLKAYRTMKKSRDTYLKRWLRASDKDGIVRFSMNADGTVSGRFSSSGDAGNGQNIPDRGGYTIKKAIIPYSDEWVFFAIDYGQLELRKACHYAENVLGLDPNMTMTRLFESGADMHSWVRDDVGVREVLFGSMSDEQVIYKLGYTMDHQDVVKSGPKAIIDKYCRQVAKTMNFGLLYSGTEYMLKKLLKLDSLAPAKVLVQRWKARFPAFSKAQDYYTNLSLFRRPLPVPEAGYGQYAQQLFSGRYRKLHKYPEWKRFQNDAGLWEGFNPKEAAAKKVWNNMVQGDGGYVCTRSFLEFYNRYGNEHLKFFAQIHDAGDGFVRRGHEDLVLRLAEIMVDWDVRPTLTVDIQRSTDGTWQGISSLRPECKDGSAPKDWAFTRGSDWSDPLFQRNWQQFLETGK
jgi:DNA polymerase I-like protein with 3'-5' exonuclease and polymerase domains